MVTRRNLATARRWAPWVLGAVATGMVPWTVVLGWTLPATTEVRHWSTAWIGLDVLMAAGCASTALLHARDDPRAGKTAAATAAVALLDAWFDVLTAQPGAPLTQALLCAVAELALAGYCTLTALTTPDQAPLVALANSAKP
jgi:hypothetical protein